MIKKHRSFLLIFGLSIVCLQAQQTVDSLQDISLKVKSDTTKVLNPKKKFNPLSPSKAAFYSAVLPGLGQIYNKRYWKLPIVYGGLATTLYFYIDNNNEMNRYRNAFKLRQAGFEDEFLGRLSDQSLEDAQNQLRRNRDLSALLTLAVYVLNIIDANVDAHLRQYNTDKRLSVRLKPYVDKRQQVNQSNFGLSLNFNF